MSNLIEHRCPECGCAFDPDDVNTFDVPLEPLLLRDVPRGMGFAILATLMTLIVIAALWGMGILHL